MNALIVTPNPEAEWQLLTAFLQATKIAARPLSEEEMEDFGLGFLMQEDQESPKVSRESVVRAPGRA